MPEEPLTIEIVTRSGAFFDRGPYDNSVTYKAGDVVQHGGATWRWRLLTPGNVLPSDLAPSWRRIGGGEGGGDGGTHPVPLSTTAGIVLVDLNAEDGPGGGPSARLPNAVDQLRFHVTSPAMIAGFRIRATSVFTLTASVVSLDAFGNAATTYATTSATTSASGYTTLTFPTPVTVTPGTSYSIDFVSAQAPYWFLDQGSVVYEVGETFGNIVLDSQWQWRAQVLGASQVKDVVGPLDAIDLPGFGAASVGQVLAKTSPTTAGFVNAPGGEGGDNTVLVYDPNASGYVAVHSIEFTGDTDVSTNAGVATVNVTNNGGGGGVFVQDTDDTASGGGGIVTESVHTIYLEGGLESAGSGDGTITIRGNALQDAITGLNTSVTGLDTRVDALEAGGTSGAALPDRLNTFGGKRLQDPYRPGAAPVLTSALRAASGAVIARGAFGAWSNGSVRDADLFRARGLLWASVTCAASAVAPYDPMLGLARSEDGGETWTAHPTPVITPPAGHGSVFSPGVVYDDATDALYQFVTLAPAGGWYSGLCKIGMFKAAPGADWTNPANWTFLGIVLEKTQAWEGTQGVYAACVRRRADGKWVQFYSSSNSAAPWFIGLAIADDIEGPYVPTGAPIIGSGTLYAEEMDAHQLPNGWWVGITDAVERDATGAPGTFYGARWWYTLDPTAETGWTLGGTLLTEQSAPGAWDSAVIGSAGGVWDADGGMTLLVSGRSTTTGTDARDLGLARLRWEGTFADLAARVEATGTPLTTEQVQDLVGAMIVAGPNIAVAYNDATGQITVEATTEGGGGGGGGGATMTVTSTTTPDYAAAVAALGPRSMWNFDESAGATVADDAVGTADGTYLNTPTFVSSGVVGGGNAMSIPSTAGAAAGGGPIMRLPAGGLVSGTGEFTVLTWFLATSTGAVLAMRTSAEYANALSINVTPTGQMIVNANNLADTPVVSIASPVLVANGRPHFVAVRRTGDTLAVFLDGVLIGSGNLGAGYAFNSAVTPTFGGQLRDGYPMLGGWIDGAAVFDSPLSDAQIASLYAAGAGFASVTGLPAGAILVRVSDDTVFPGNTAIVGAAGALIAAVAATGPVLATSRMQPGQTLTYNP